MPHFRPFTQLAADLSSGNVARYNFITPNLCDDMHGNTGCPSTPEITQGDTWLKTNVPVIIASDAYKNGGAIFITWDESEGGELPIGMIVVSPFAKGHGYAGIEEVLPLVDAPLDAGDLLGLALSQRRREPAGSLGPVLRVSLSGRASRAPGANPMISFALESRERACCRSCTGTSLWPPACPSGWSWPAT